jgi:hypothetical protein
MDDAPQLLARCRVAMGLCRRIADELDMVAAAIEAGHPAEAAYGVHDLIGGACADLVVSLDVLSDALVAAAGRERAGRRGG